MGRVLRLFRALVCQVAAAASGSRYASGRDPQKCADGATLQMQAVGRYLHMTLIEAEAEKDYFAAQQFFVMTRQISQLQNICHNMPYVIWQTTDEDPLIWQTKPIIL